MIVTKKCLSRRTVLRGVGAAIALPLLDGMVPAFAAIRHSAANPVRRFGAVYVPMGMHMAEWTPAVEGPLELSPILQMLEPLKSQLLVVSGLDHSKAYLSDAGPHSRCQATWLTGAAARPSEGPGIHLGTSMDQIAAIERGGETALPSLELAIEDVDFVGTCGAGYSCAYSNTLAWRTPTTPLPMENNPRAVFERLFGATDSTDPQARLVDMRQDRSLLDSVTGQIGHFEKGLGPSDRARVEQYLEAVRDVERRVQRAEQQAAQELPVVDKPMGVPAAFADHVKLMFDLLALAFQCDLTRVSTFLISREASVRSYPEIGIPDSHHPLSHHNHQPDKLAKQSKVNKFHLSLFKDFLDELQSTPDGDGSLLDHTLLLYGSGLSDSHFHLPFDLPTLVAGGTGMGLRGGRHIRAPKGTPFTNLQLSLLDRIGVHVDSLGDSNGRLDVVSGV